MVVAVHRSFCRSLLEAEFYSNLHAYVFYERSTAKFVSFEYQGGKISKKLTGIRALIFLKNHRSDVMELIDMEKTGEILWYQDS